MKVSVLRFILVFFSVYLALSYVANAGPTTKYFDWIRGRGLANSQTNWLADPDLDGLNNFEEYAWGGDPSFDDASAIQPILSFNNGSMMLVYRRRQDDLELTYELWSNIDLSNTIGWLNSGTLFETDSDVSSEPHVAVFTNTIDCSSASQFYQFAFNVANFHTTYPDENTNALITALKGVRPNDSDSEEFYHTLKFDHIPWNVLELDEADTVDQMLTRCRTRWGNLEEKGLRVIPHVNVQPWFKNIEDGLPNGLTKSDYLNNTTLFQKRLRLLIAKLAQAWDNDPRIAWINIGFYGEGGSHEFSNTEPHSFITKEQQEILRSSFNSAFKNKKIMMNYSPDFPYDEYGIYNRSWAHPYEREQENSIYEFNNKTGRWKIAPITGQLSYYNPTYLVGVLGINADQTLSTPAYLDYLLDVIRKNHCNTLGSIGNYTESSSYEGAANIQKALGYRFVITEASWTKRVDAGKNINFSFTVKNMGSAPFYYDWPVFLYFLNPLSKKPEATIELGNIDITDWLPGDNWDSDNNDYQTEASNYTESASIMVPEDLPNNKYILALGIVDPQSNTRAVRFAITNYYKGVYYPLGYIGVGENVTTGFELDSFDPPGTYAEQKAELAYTAAKNSFTDTIIAPIANAGPDQSLADRNGQGYESVNLDGSLSYDPDGKIVTYIWTENCIPVATGMVSSIQLYNGEHTLTLTISDTHGATATDTVIIHIDGPIDHQPINLLHYSDFSDYRYKPVWYLWTKETAGATGNYSFDDGRAFIDIDSIGSQSWEIQFMYMPSLLLHSGNDYNISFDAYSPSGSKELVIRISNENNNERYYEGDIVIDGEMKTHHLSFSAPISDMSVLLRFFCAKSTDNLYIDNVKLYQSEN